MAVAEGSLRASRTTRTAAGWGSGLEGAGCTVVGGAVMGVTHSSRPTGTMATMRMRGQAKS